MKPAMHLVSEAPDLLSESPVWDHRSGRLFWVDGTARRVHGLDPASGERRQWTTPSMVGSIALAAESRLVCDLADGIWMLDLTSGAFDPVFRPESGHSRDPLRRRQDRPAGPLRRSGHRRDR